MPNGRVRRETYDRRPSVTDTPCRSRSNIPPGPGTVETQPVAHPPAPLPTDSRDPVGEVRGTNGYILSTVPLAHVEWREVGPGVGPGVV